MAGETPVTVIGNLTADPELRYTGQGTAVANVTVASTPRYFDKQAGSWQDGDPLFLRGTLWREMAEHAAESLSKGTRVIVSGRLKQRSFETQNGDKRTVVELDIDEIGPSVRFTHVTVAKATRSKPSESDRGSDLWDSGEPSF